jgi:putative hydrolase of the HAD superfamily
MSQHKYQHLFFDLDHTIWDFETNAKNSMQVLYDKFELQQKGITDFDLFYKQYSHHNNVLWERYRNGFIKQEDLRWKRMFRALLDFKIGDEKLAKQMSVDFLELLPTRNTLFPYTIELLEYLLQKKYQIHLITNGFVEVQHQKIKFAALEKYFTTVTTSQESNSLKPHKEIFLYALEKAKATTAESIMIGDNLEADIEGAKNVGIDTIWVNHLNEPNSNLPTYTVTHLKAIEQVL